MQNFPLPLDTKNAAMQEAVSNSRKELTDLLKRQCGSQVMLGAAVTTGGTGVPLPLGLLSKHTSPVSLENRQVRFLRPVSHCYWAIGFINQKALRFYIEEASFQMYYIAG